MKDLEFLLALLSLAILSFGFGLWFSIKFYSAEIKLYGQADQIISDCEKFLPRNETCELVALTKEQIESLK